MLKKFTFLFFVLLLISCKNDKNNSLVNSINDTSNLNLLENNFSEWWDYQNKNIELSLIFKSFDEDNNEITNIDFLKKLASGNYIPINIKKGEIIDEYKLLKLTSNANIDIQKTIKQIASKQLSNLSKEGKTFPIFNLKDINGNNISNDSFKNKVTIVKCWFINCKACIAEFPELNALVKNYSQNENIDFISMAFDSENDLIEFVQKHPLNFKTIPVKKEFLQDQLNINEYPTHLVINKDGKIEKIFNNAKTLIKYLEKRIPNSTFEKNTSLAPPPTE